jgi:predicted RNase H-like nuclease (RuvC/YqgF family)
MAKVTELDKEHASMSSHVSRLLCSYERFYEMAQEEKMLIERSSKDKFEHLQKQHVDLSSENNALKVEIEELKSRILELQKTQEIVMVQHVEECQVAEDKIRRLESEAEISASNINRLEKLASELQGRVQKLLEDSTLAENHKVCRLLVQLQNCFLLIEKHLMSCKIPYSWYLFCSKSCLKRL